MLAIHNITPSIAVLYPNSATGNLSGIPVHKNQFKYFQTVADAIATQGKVQAALQSFLATQQNGTLGAVELQATLDGELCVGTLPGEWQPVFIYNDLSLQVFIVNYSISFQVPLPPNQPGPFNPPVSLNGSVAIGDIAGDGDSGIVASYQGGNFFFTWK